MANRVKEDEKNERVIRGLLKLPDNRRCINCSSLGPQYVCINFWTFVCTTCSGIHREFTHRVKSISMAKFTSQEVTALQGGGNQRAREIYFKEWDPQRQSAPDSSNVDRLRDFIKHVYVDGRYTGERNYGKPPSGKMGDKEDFYDNRRTDAYEKGSRSPPYEDSYDRRYSERSSPGGRNDDKYSRYSYDDRRSPGSDDYKRSPARLQVVNDWRREDRFGNRISEGESKHEARSPEPPKEPEASSPPVVRPVREILGDNTVPLRISEPPKTNGAKTADGIAQTQRTASSNSLASTSGNTVEVKLENTKSLIDFDADPEPSAPAVQPAQPAAMPQAVTQPTSATNNNNWASFDFAPAIKASQPPLNANSLDSVLSQLSVVPSGPSHLTGMPGVTGASSAAPVGTTTVLPSPGASLDALVGTTSMLPFNSGTSATAQNNFSTLHTGGPVPPALVNGGNTFVKVAEVGHWQSTQQQQPSLFPASSGISTAQHFAQQYAGVSANQQTWNSSSASNVQATFATSAGMPPVVSSEAGSSGVSQPSVMEAKSSGRQALPEDLFVASYQFASPFPGWQAGQHRGMGFMHHNHVAAPIPTFPQQPSKSTNPFDLNEPVRAQTFPSLASLESALPNMPPASGIQRSVSLGAPSHTWMPLQSSPYPSSLPFQTPSYAAAVPPRAYMVQQVPGSVPLSGHQAIGGLGSEVAAFGTYNMDQQVAGRLSAPTTPQPFPSVGGNPFG